jgi:DNA modification methylase
MVEVFREVRRVLRADGTLWVNLGDSYAHDAKKGRATSAQSGKHGYLNGRNQARADLSQCAMKPKDLVGIPWMMAFALRADGWYLRSDIVWSKPNPMPESVTDRPTKSHEYVFLLSKSERYYYDAEAIREPAEHSSIKRWMQNVDAQEGSHRANAGAKTNGTMKAVGGPRRSDKQRGHSRRHDGFNQRWDGMSKAEQAEMGRNKRTVWTVATKPFSEAHFATYPPELIEPCILAGSPPGGTVLDPFFGAGTTGLVADRLQRNCIGIELNPQYVEIAERRLKRDAGMLADIVVPV